MNNLGRASGITEPKVSTALNSVINVNAEIISIPHLIVGLLSIQRIASLFSPDLLNKVKEHIKSNPVNSSNDDDPDSKTSKFAVEMVELARQNKFDPVIGRDSEIRQIIEILAKKTKSNAIMVGKPGVGKTAIVNGIAIKIAKGECLEGYKIYNVDIGSMVAGSSHRGDFEERLKGLVKESVNSKIVLFIDEIHILLGAGKADGALDAANILKPALADGSLKVIGATTYDEYRKYVSKDPAFERRFVRVDVKEPSIEDTITMLRGLKERIETHHGVKISNKALVYASTYGKKYVPNRRLPDLAIDLVDTACASAIISLNSEPEPIQILKNKIWSLEIEKTSIEMDLKNNKNNKNLSNDLQLVDKKIEDARLQLQPLIEQYNKEKGHLSEAKKIKQKLEDAKNRVEIAKRNNDRYAVYDLQTNIIPVYEEKLKEFSSVEIIQPEHVAEVISKLTKIPVSRLNIKENEKLANMESRIKQKIFGQDNAVETVVNSILASRVGLGRENKPIGSFLFVGPTGVGKTELSKMICQELNDSCENMVILDMSDYCSEISINKLLGTPAGYVGCEEGGTLTEPIKEMPYNVVLLDEVDLAHSSVVNVLYQLLDEGRITDGRGVKVSFKNTVVIMTTNLGQDFIYKDGSSNTTLIEEVVLKKFGHPLINRIDNIVVFNHLSYESLCSIFNKEILELNLKLREKNLIFSVSDMVVDFAVTSAMNTNYGARVLKRFVKDNFINALTKIILSKSEDQTMKIKCYMKDENVIGTHYSNFTFVIDQQ